MYLEYSDLDFAAYSGPINKTCSNDTIIAYLGMGIVRMSNIVIPEGDSQLAWVKWHTPSEPQDITITVRTNRGTLSQTTIKADVVDLSVSDPPDPKAADTAGSWRPSSVPSREEKSCAAWSVWWAREHPYWVWHSNGDGDGYWVGLV